jgi:hypothetical protein
VVVAQTGNSQPQQQAMEVDENFGTIFFGRRFPNKLIRQTFAEPISLVLWAVT